MEQFDLISYQKNNEDIVDVKNEVGKEIEEVVSRAKILNDSIEKRIKDLKELKMNKRIKSSPMGKKKGKKIYDNENDWDDVPVSSGEIIVSSIKDDDKVSGVELKKVENKNAVNENEEGYLFRVKKSVKKEKTEVLEEIVKTDSDKSENNVTKNNEVLSSDGGGQNEVQNEKQIEDDDSVDDRVMQMTPGQLSWGRFGGPRDKKKRRDAEGPIKAPNAASMSSPVHVLQVSVFSVICTIVGNE